MKLIERSVLESASKSQKWFEYTIPSSDFQVGFILGGAWVEQQLQPLFVEFGNWILKNWTPMWVVNLWVNKKTGEELTTEELFLLWIESKQTKK